MRRPINGTLLQTIWLSTLLAVAYVASGFLSSTLAIVDGDIRGMLFLPAGIALAFLVVFGSRLWFAAFCGHLILMLLQGNAWLTAALLSTGSTCTLLLGSWLFWRWRLSVGLDTARDVLLLLALIFGITQPLNTLVQTAILPLDGQVAPGQAFQSWLYAWLGNSLGQLLVAPALIVWRARPNSWHARDYLGIACLSAALLILLLLPIGNTVLYSLAILPLVYPPLVWVAMRWDTHGAVLINIPIAAALVWAGHAQTQLFGLNLDQDSFTYISFFIASSCIASLMVAALFNEHREQMRKLALQANTDPLVDMSNRRFFFERANTEVVKQLKYKQPVALLLLDIDHFKKTNDDYGHAVGDEVLKAVARNCMAAARRSDLAARIGGEEFALLLPKTSPEQALAVAERLRLAIENDTSVTVDGVPVRATISIGVSNMNSASLDQALIHADEALYQAKRSGRNRVCLAAQST